MRRLDLVGKRFGRLTVYGYDGKSHWNCRCDCGNVCRVFTGNLTFGNHTKSCGCYNLEAIKERKTKHGKTGSAEYVAWQHMISRCYNQKNKDYKRWGGRGIRVCERWRYSFDNFIADMGNKPTPQHTVERLDNNGIYEPSNCAWGTRKQQRRNSRGLKLSMEKAEEIRKEQRATTRAIASKYGVCDSTIRRVKAGIIWG